MSSKSSFLISLDQRYASSNISSEIKEATERKLLKRQIKLSSLLKKTSLTFPSLHLPSTKVTLYSDATFNNVSNGYS